MRVISRLQQPAGDRVESGLQVHAGDLLVVPQRDGHILVASEFLTGCDVPTCEVDGCCDRASTTAVEALPSDPSGLQDRYDASRSPIPQLDRTTTLCLKHEASRRFATSLMPQGERNSNRVDQWQRPDSVLRLGCADDATPHRTPDVDRRAVDVIPLQALNLAGSKSQETRQHHHDLKIDMLHESGDDVLGLFERVEPDLLHRLRLHQQLHTVDRIHIEHTHGDGVCEQAGQQGSNMVDRVAIVIACERVQERGPDMWLVLCEGLPGEVSAEMRVPDLTIPGHG